MIQIELYNDIERTIWATVFGHQAACVYFECLTEEDTKYRAAEFVESANAAVMTYRKYVSVAAD